MLPHVCHQLQVTVRGCNRAIQVAVEESNIRRSFTPSVGHIGTTSKKNTANSQRVKHPSEMVQLGERRHQKKKMVSEKRQENLELSITNHFLHYNSAAYTNNSLRHEQQIPCTTLHRRNEFAEFTLFYTDQLRCAQYNLLIDTFISTLTYSRRGAESFLRS